MTAPVHLIESKALADHPRLVTITGSEARHAISVRRLRVGERLDLIDGCGIRMQGEVQEVREKVLVVRALNYVYHNSPQPTLTLVQALAKGGRDEQAIEAATETGVNRVVPWQAQRSIARWQGNKTAKGLARWAAVLQEATKQSRRAYIPDIEEIESSSDVARRITKVVSSSGLALVIHESAKVSVSGLTEEIQKAKQEILVIVGPEGGITDSELELFNQAGARIVGAGQQVMRSSTAGPVVIGYLSAILGRWDEALYANTL